MLLDAASFVDGIPDQNRFPGPGELDDRLRDLADRFPGLARREQVGVARSGEPIDLLTIGSGPRHALVFAGAHPNEPVGYLTMSYLVELLCADTPLCDALGHTWHLVGCVDPDGARLNSGLYGGPLTYAHYARNPVPPTFSEQVEWTFPVAGDPEPAVV